MQNLKLTDLIDISVLQKIQNAFSDFTQMAALIADENGTPITEESHFTRFCTDLTRQSPIGYERCKECDRNGGMKTLKYGTPSVYQCHAGLCDFSAPIIVDGCYIGCIMGGQILTKPLDEDLIRLRAAEYGIDENVYLAAAREITIKSEEDVYKAADFLFEVAQCISEMAYKNYKALKASRSLEKSACTQASFIIDMSSELRKNMKNWILMAANAVESNNIDTIRDITKTFIDEGRAFLSSIEDTVEYAKMTDGEIELIEEEYNVRESFEKILRDDELKNTGNIAFEISDNVPDFMFGDIGRIGQAVNRLLLHMHNIAPDGELAVKVSCPHCSYAAELKIEIGITGASISPEKIYGANNSFNNRYKYFTEISSDDIGLTVTGRIIKQMHGSVSAVENENSSLGFVISVPQLEVSAG